MDLKVDALASRFEAFANVQSVHSASPTSGVGSSVPLLGAAASVRHDVDEYQICDRPTAIESTIASPAPLSTPSGDAAVLLPTTRHVVAPSGSADTSSIPLNEAEPDFFVGHYVTLHALQAHHMNGRSGVITGVATKSGRFGVRLHGDREDKAILPKNMRKYDFDGTEMCVACKEPVDLNSFPSCDSDPPTAISRSERA